MGIDRRDAIKKPAVGGATVATASAVISSPAPADDLPTPRAVPVVGATTTNNEVDLRVSLLPGGATCAASAVGGSSVIGVGHDSSGSDASASPSSESSTGGGELVVEFSRVSTATATIDHQARCQCIHAGGPGEVCRSWTISFGTNDQDVVKPWNVSPQISSPGTTCPFWSSAARGQLSREPGNLVGVRRHRRR